MFLLRALPFLFVIISSYSAAMALEIRGWNGKLITHRCHAAPDNLNGFMATLRSHEAARIGFKYKMKHGIYRVRDILNSKYKQKNAEETIEIIVKNLIKLSTPASERSPFNRTSISETKITTAALVYDIGLANNKYSICVWLITERGIELAITTPLPDKPLSRMLRDSLSITARAASRTPKRRNRSKRSKRDRGFVPAISNTDTTPSHAIKIASSVLLPAKIAERLSLDDIDRLLILPAADLSAIPFAALEIEGKPLIKFVAPVILADIEGLIGGWYPRRSIRGSKLIVGDPKLYRDRKWVFPPLPGARREAENAAHIFGSRVIVGEAASRRNVLRKLKRSRDLALIYFATHGISDAINPMDGSFLALSKGHLYARDIKKLKFEYHPTVVMSACQTGLGKTFEGGIFGLARAWHAAGASQIITSLWNIDDEATKNLMAQFSEQLSIGIPAEIALQKAMLNQRNRTPDPIYWAGFSLFGLPYDPKTIIR